MIRYEHIEGKRRSVDMTDAQGQDHIGARVMGGFDMVHDFIKDRDGKIISVVWFLSLTWSHFPERGGQVWALYHD